MIWKRISLQQTLELKWILLLEFMWLELVDIKIGQSEVWWKKRDMCVCKIDVKCNIASEYFFALHIQKSAIYKSKEISIGQNLPPLQNIKKMSTRNTFDHYKTNIRKIPQPLIIIIIIIIINTDLGFPGSNLRSRHIGVIKMITGSKEPSSWQILLCKTKFIVWRLNTKGVRHFCDSHWWVDIKWFLVKWEVE